MHRDIYMPCTGYTAHNQKNCNKFLRLQLQLINDLWECLLYKSCVLLLSLTDESFLNIYFPFKDVVIAKGNGVLSFLNETRCKILLFSNCTVVYFIQTATYTRYFVEFNTRLVLISHTLALFTKHTRNRNCRGGNYLTRILLNIRTRNEPGGTESK